MTIWDDSPEYGRVISYPPSEALARLVEEDKRLALEAITVTATYVMGGEIKRPPLDEPFETDVSGNPRQFECSSSHLDNILMVRDEDLARKAVQTVRAVEE